MKFLYIASIIFFAASCSNGNNNKSTKSNVASGYKNISAERKIVNPNPVQVYAETTKSFETTDEFKVSLFETKETFHYLIKMQYKNLEEEDTLKVPDFGMDPAVKIIKGDKRPSCIIGFLDEQKQFRESKLIYFEDDALKVHVLKHYGVFQEQQ